MSRTLHIILKKQAMVLLCAMLLAVFWCEGVSLAASAPTISLRESIKATLHNHRSLRAIQENRLAVEHEKDRAARGYGPRVDAVSGAGVGVLSDVNTRALRDSGTFYPQSRVGVTLTQPLWDGYATRSRVRTAASTLDSMTWRVLDNATTLALDAIIAHIDLLRRKSLAALARENVTQHQHILSKARERERAGADTRADVSKAESRLARAQTALVEAQAGLLDAQDTYTRLTTLSAYGKLENVTMPALDYADSGAVLHEAQTANPKLAAYLHDINAARAQQQLAKSALWPVVTLEAGPNYTARGDKANTWTYSLDAMLMLRWNLFNSGADMAADNAAAARVRQARQVMYSFYDDLDLAIKQSWTAHESAQEQHMFWSEARTFSRTTLSAYSEQFLLGQRSLLDILDAESELYNASVQAVTTQSNISIAAYRLWALAGVLLSRLDIPTDNLLLPPPPAGRDGREKY